jgi:hypothetical protein
MPKMQFPHKPKNVLDLFVNSQQHSPAPEKACPQDSTNHVAEPRNHDLADTEDHYRSVVREMVDLGADLLRMVHQEAQQADAARRAAAEPSYNPTTFPAAKSASDLAVAYDLIFRSMRRAILLDRKLSTPQKAPAAPNRTAARKRIIREVEDAIQGEARGDHAESLHAELIERLDSPDLEDEIATRTIPQIVQDICRDFGIAGLDRTHPYKRRIPHDIAVLNARAEQMPGAEPSEKLAALLASAPPRPTAPPGSDPPPDLDDDDDADMDIKTLLKRIRQLRETHKNGR